MRALCILLWLVFLAPFAALAGTALASADLSGFSLHAVEILALLRSLGVSLLAALAATLLGATLAFLVCFRPLPLRRPVERLLVLPLLFPPFVLAAVYRELLSTSGVLVRSAGLPAALACDVESTGGFVFVLTLGLYPYAYLLCRTAFEAHGRTSLELGRSLGLSPARAALRILAPLSLGAVLLGGGLVLIEAASEWAAASLLSVDTGALILHELWFARGNPQFAAQLALACVLAALLLLLLAGRWTRRTLGRRPLSMPADLPPAAAEAGGRRAWLRLAGCLIPCLLGFAVPAASALVHFLETLNTIDLNSLLGNSLDTLALVATVACLCLLFGLLLHASQRPTSGFARGLALRWFTTSYLVPPAALAVGSLVLADQLLVDTQRYGDLTSFLVLALTLAGRLAIFVLLPLHVGRSLLPQQAEEVGAALGLDRARAFLRVSLPRLRPFLLMGLLLLIVQVLRETAISVVLSPFGFRTLVLQAYSDVSIDALPRSGAWILALALLGLYPLLTIESLLSRRAAVEG